jgi:hypothetical protein
VSTSIRDDGGDTPGEGKITEKRGLIGGSSLLLGFVTFKLLPIEGDTVSRSLWDQAAIPECQLLFQHWTKLGNVLHENSAGNRCRKMDVQLHQKMWRDGHLKRLSRTGDLEPLGDSADSHNP